MFGTEKFKPEIPWPDKKCARAKKRHGRLLAVLLAAEVANEHAQREVWLRLALMWAAAARQSREEGAIAAGVSPLTAITVKLNG